MFDMYPHPITGLANVKRQLDQVVAFEARTALGPASATAGTSATRGRRPLKPRSQAAREHSDQVGL